MGPVFGGNLETILRDAGLLLTATGGTAFAGWGAWNGWHRRQQRIWQQVAAQTSLVMRWSGGPRLSGVYRGRAIDAGQTNGVLQIAVLITNPLHLMNELSHSTPLDNVCWISPVNRETLSALQALGRQWHITVRGQLVTFACTRITHRPTLLRFALDLACDLADTLEKPITTA